MTRRLGEMRERMEVRGIRPTVLMLHPDDPLHDLFGHVTDRVTDNEDGTFTHTLKGGAMRKILAPHKEQDGWRYWRVFTKPARRGNMPDEPKGAVGLWELDEDGKRAAMVPFAALKASNMFIGYDEHKDGSRVISSRRVEEAVETADYLKRCADEGLTAQLGNAHRPDMKCWYVWSPHNYLTWPQDCGSGDTLREAYHRYKAAAQ